MTKSKKAPAKTPRTVKPRVGKAIKQPETYADFLEQAWEQFRVHHERDTISPLNYPFKVGDEVQYGNRQEVRIEEMLEDGRLLHLSYHDRGQSYGKPWDNHRRLPLLVWWVDVYPIVGGEPTRFARERTNVNFMNSHLYSLIHRARYRGLLDSPEYQRGYVWTDADRHRLIQSVFFGSDIGSFVFLNRPDDTRMEVIDGKQRLRTLLDFVEGRFAYEGKTWFQISQRDKTMFQNVTVQTVELNSDLVKRSDVLWLFLSVNAAGVPQTEEHISAARELYEQALSEEAASPQTV